MFWNEPALGSVTCTDLAQNEKNIISSYICCIYVMVNLSLSLLSGFYINLSVIHIQGEKNIYKHITHIYIYMIINI